jgi:hypothetical protein
MDETDAKRIAGNLAKIMGLMCVRNTMIEDIHAGVVPVSKTGDYSDVVVVDATGRKIPWTEVSHFDDDAMRSLMQQVVNRLYTFHLKTDDIGFHNLITRWTSIAKTWDDPELDEIFLREIEQIQDM